MKKFETPDAEIALIVVEDVITASYTQPGFEGWAPDSDDSEFG